MSHNSQSKTTTQNSTSIFGHTVNSARDSNVLFSVLNVGNIKLLGWWKTFRSRKAEIARLRSKIGSMKIEFKDKSNQYLQKIEFLEQQLAREKASLSYLEKTALQLAEAVQRLAESGKADAHSLAVLQRLKLATDDFEKGEKGFRACKRAANLIQEEMEKWIQNELKRAKLNWPDKFRSRIFSTKYTSDLYQYLKGAKRSLLYGDFCSLAALQIEPELPTYNRLYSISLKAIRQNISSNELDAEALEYLNSFIKNIEEQVAGIQVLSS